MELTVSPPELKSAPADCGSNDIELLTLRVPAVKASATAVLKCLNKY